MMEVLEVLEVMEVMGVLEVMEVMGVMEVLEVLEVMEVMGVLEVMEVMEVVGLMEVMGLRGEGHRDNGSNGNDRKHNVFVLFPFSIRCHETVKKPLCTETFLEKRRATPTFYRMLFLQTEDYVDTQLGIPLSDIAARSTDKNKRL